MDGNYGDATNNYGMVEQPATGGAEPYTPVTGGVEPNPYAGQSGGVTTQTMTIAPQAQMTALQRKLQAMYTDPNMTNEANWQGNKYTGPDATYTGVNGQGTASAGYQMGGGMQSYMSQYDPEGISQEEMRAGLAAGKAGTPLSQEQIDAFLQRPGASQQYQSLAASYAPVLEQQRANAAGMAASATANSGTFQERLNAMYGPNDPHRIATNYTEQANNGTYIGPGSQQEANTISPKPGGSVGTAPGTSTHGTIPGGTTHGTIPGATLPGTGGTDPGAGYGTWRRPPVSSRPTYHAPTIEHQEVPTARIPTGPLTQVHQPVPLSQLNQPLPSNGWDWQNQTISDYLANAANMRRRG